MSKILSVRRANLRGKTVLLRVDFNVEMRGGKIVDDYRIRALIPTIEFLVLRGAKPILLSHLGRPKGNDAKSSLKPVAAHLSRLLGRHVIFFENVFDRDFPLFLNAAPAGTVVMLENLRFWRGEEANDAAFARRLARLGDLYVNDAFAVSHRKNASVAAITRYLPSYAGLLLEKEITMLEKVKRAASHPFVVILGGKKLSTKLPLIKAFIRKADAILTGGGVANSFLGAAGVDIGKSITERPFASEARHLLREKSIVNVPADWKVDKGRAIFDIGPRTAREYGRAISKARMILWNGPMGVFEEPKFAAGSYAVARAIAKNRRAFSVVGGGETVAVVRKLKLEKKISFVSTGGGAMLEFLAGKKLPGITALERTKAPSSKPQ